MVKDGSFGWYAMNSPVESYLRILDAWQWFDLLDPEFYAPHLSQIFNETRRSSEHVRSRAGAFTA